MLPLFDRTPGSSAALPALAADALARGAMVLTSNRRAARSLQAAYARMQRAKAGRELTAWPTASIFEWSSWLSNLWNRYTLVADDDQPLPLAPLQEKQLWQQVMGRDRDLVVAPEKMAELAQEAYALLGNYAAHPLRRDAAGPWGASHQDADRFLVWAGAFDRLCERQGWVSSSRLSERLIAAIPLLDLPRQLVLIGFDRVTPAQQALLAAIAEAGTEIIRQEAEPPKAAPNVFIADDPRHQMEACARWCRGLLEEGAHPSALRIGVIAADLDRLQPALDRVFRRVLMPQTTLWPQEADPLHRNPRPDPPPPYEFSLGTPLAQLPPVHAALLVLRWLTSPLPAADLTWLLTSGFLASSVEDEPVLARFDAELRRSPDRSPRVSLAAVGERRHAAHLPLLVRGRLRSLQARVLREHLAEKDSARSHAQWSDLASSLLADSGWPGPRAADSVAFQVRQRWERLLAELATLGFDGSRVSWNAFLKTLEEAAQSTLFAAESTDAPIQIMGAYESSGQTFDALWFLGLDDQRWPAVGRPHPLLPLWLQRETSMPHATPQADRELAQSATARILSSAPVVALSYARQEQGIALRPSPLLPASASPLTLTLAAETAGPAAVALESTSEPLGHSPWPVDRVAGGADVLKQQAACAFQSFATRRLEARSLEHAEQGLDAAERGTLLHQVMERLWSAAPGEPMRLHSQDDLRRAIDDGSLSDLVTHHIDAALTARAGAEPQHNAWLSAYLECERSRLLERVLAWLQVEADRRPFRVFAIEQDRKAIRVGALQLNVRPDRIDTLADQTHLLLDYKSGKIDAGAWEGERPGEPQLPLYAVFGEVDAVSGVAFAQIRAKETRLIACAEDVAAQVSENLRAGVKSRFDDEVRDEWGASLVALADEFVAGDARVNPRDGFVTCRWCPLAGLCRVHATDLVDSEDEDQDDA